MKTVTRTDDDPVGGPPPDLARVITKLQEHIPLALLCDLTEPSGPTSQEILDTEGEPAERWWE
jgi:mRNA degradation ribonuclease J1/J2